VDIYADETAVRRVIGNLVDNALKFTPSDGRVTVRTRIEGPKTVILEVQDTGIGIAEEALPTVFDAFKQESEGLTREYEGAGLGLSIVQKLVEALGGRIDVDSAKGEGTRVTVRLPRTSGDGSSSSVQ
jgi:signal transduction histidine kinase